MRSFKKLGYLIGLIKYKTFNSSFTARVNSHYCFNNYTSVYNAKSTTASTKNINVLKELPISNILLSRNFSLSTICNAKGKDRVKEKKKPKVSKIDLRELGEVFDVDELTGQMSKTIDNLKMDFIKNLTLRSTTGSLEQIPIKLDGKDYQLQELAQIARKPKLIVLNVASFPTAIPLIIKAIEKSGLNINPQQEGTTIFLPIPKVTKEHRENLSKNAKAIFIKHRDELKDLRNKAIKSLKKKKDVSEDTAHRIQTQIEALCDKYLKEAEIVLETKQNELLGSSD